MDASLEPTPELNELSSQAGQAKSAADEPTIQDIRSWDKKKLLPWIQKKLSVPLEPTDTKKLLNIGINGSVFLQGAGNKEFFQSAGLSFGASVQLAELARETRDSRQAGVKEPSDTTSKESRLDDILEVLRRVEPELAAELRQITDSKSKAQKLTLKEALSKKGLTEKAQHGLSALTREERVGILGYLGAEPKPGDKYGRLLSVAQNLPRGWNPEESIHPNMDDKTFKFPVINQRALFVRKCYHELYDIIIKSPITTIEPLRILLTGTPGIGKSSFLIYFIIRHLYKSITAPNSEENPVISSSGMRDILIFQPAGSDGEYYAFAGPDIVRKGTYSDFEDFFFLPTTWYLVDWKPVSPPKNEDAATLFALSPNSIQDNNFKDFEKVLFTVLCMPVWTYDELEECRHFVFPELPKESLNYIYDRVGGVPRSCLEAPTGVLRAGLSKEEAHKRGLRRLEDAFRVIKDPLRILYFQKESSGIIKVSGRLLHKVPGLEYQDSRRHVWASAYVIDRFVNLIDAQSANNMHCAVRDGLARNERDGTLGKIFECYVRHLFFRGGGTELRKRRLYQASDQGKESEAEERFTIPEKSKHKLFNRMADFSIPEEDNGTIWTPGPNFPSVDVILTPNSLFQITISQRHPVKQEPLRQILEKLPAKENIALYFIVPDDNFETFAFQNYLNEQGNVSQVVHKPIRRLEQWVLGVRLKERLSRENAEQPEVQGIRERTASEDDM